MKALFEAGFPAVTRMDVYGRGKQRGLKVGDVTYDELPKELLLICIKESDKEFVIDTIMETASSGPRGNLGDGKIFVTPVLESFTILTGLKEV